MTTSTVKIQKSSITSGIPRCCPFMTHPPLLDQLCPLPLATTNLSSISKFCYFKGCFINGIIQYVTFGQWCFSLNIIPWRWTQIVACISRLFLFITKKYPIVWTYHSLTIHLLNHIWVFSSFGLFWIKLLWTCNVDSHMNMCSFLRNKCPEVQLLRHIVVACLVSFFFLKKMQTFFKMAVPFYLPTCNVWMTQFLCILTRIWCYHFFNFNNSDRYVIVTCGFTLHFPDDWWYWTLFRVLICFLASSVLMYYNLFSKMSVTIVLRVLKYILDTRFLVDTWFANTFYEYVDCLFILFRLFAEQMFLILMRSYLSNFAFMDWAFGIESKNSFPDFLY